MGPPTPYRRLAFPDAADGGLDLPQEADIAGDRVLAAQETFLKALTLHHGKRIVLKSPFHIARVAALRQRYPDALFVHMVFDLGAVGLSTVNFWRTLEDGHRIGPPLADESRRSAFVGAVCDWMYGRLIADEAKLPPHVLLTVRYDDLVADPLAVVRRICARLPDIGDPDLTAARANLTAVDGFRTNRFDPEPGIYADANLTGTYTARYFASSAAGPLIPRTSSTV